MSGLDLIYEQMGWPQSLRVARHYDCPTCGATTARPCSRPARGTRHGEAGRRPMVLSMHPSRFAIAAPCELHEKAAGRPCPPSSWAPETPQVCEARMVAVAEVAGAHTLEAAK